MRPPPIFALVVVALVAACTADPGSTGSVECRESIDGALTLTAESLEFDTGCLALPAGEPVTVTLENADTQSHNLAIYTDSTKSTQLFVGEIIDGGESIENVFELEAGTYYFDCTVHPGMKGTVTVQ
jgi:plastocyanin